MVYERVESRAIKIVEDPDTEPGARFDETARTITVGGELTAAERRAAIGGAYVRARKTSTRPAPLWAEIKDARDCDEVAARQLIHLDDLADALSDCDTIHAVADWLGVDTRMLHARIAALTPAEDAFLDGATVDRAQQPGVDAGAA